MSSIRGNWTSGFRDPEDPFMSDDKLALRQELDEMHKDLQEITKIMKRIVKLFGEIQKKSGKV